MVAGGETLNVAFRSAEGQPRTPGWAWRHCPGSYCRGVGAGTWRPRLMVPQCASVGGPQRCFPQQFHLEQLMLHNRGVDCTPHRHQGGLSSENCLQNPVPSRGAGPPGPPFYLKSLHTCVMYIQQDERACSKWQCSCPRQRGDSVLLSFFCLLYLLIFL